MKQVFLSYHDIHADCIELAKILIHGYYACVSYTDKLIGDLKHDSSLFFHGY